MANFGDLEDFDQVKNLGNFTREIVPATNKIKECGWKYLMVLQYGDTDLNVIMLEGLDKVTALDIIKGNLEREVAGLVDVE